MAMATKQHIEAAQKSLSDLIQLAADNRYSDEGIGMRFRTHREEFNCLTAIRQPKINASDVDPTAGLNPDFAWDGNG